MVRSHKMMVQVVLNCKVCKRLIIAELAANAGRGKSKAKARASRLNGKLGGRPKGT